VLRGAGSLLTANPGPVWIVELIGLGTRYGTDDAQVHAMFSRLGYHALRYRAIENQLTTWNAADLGRGNVIFARDPNAVRERLSLLPTTQMIGA
jgi:hypothetical protein